MSEKTTVSNKELLAVKIDAEENAEPGYVDLNISLVDVLGNLTGLDVALISLVQHNQQSIDLTRMQITAPTHFFYEQTNLYQKIFSEKEFIQDLKGTVKHTNALKKKIYPKDSGEEVESFAAKESVLHSGVEKEAWSKEYFHGIDGLRDKCKFIWGDKEIATEDVKNKIKKSTEESLSVFVCNSTLRDTFEQIYLRLGRPTVVAIYGHGGNNELVDPSGGYDHITGEAFATQLFESGLRPKVVMFVCCNAINVASKAHDCWSKLAGDSTCLFIGPNREVSATDAFRGDAYPTRFLASYLYSTLCVKEQKAFKWICTFPSGEKIVWERPDGTDITSSMCRELFMLCHLHNYTIDNAYFTGCDSDMKASYTERSERWNILNHAQDSSVTAAPDL